MPETEKDVGIKSRNVIWTQISAEEKHYSITFPILTFIKKKSEKNKRGTTEILAQ